MIRHFASVALIAGAMAAQEQAVRTKFEVRYVASGAVYINGGREDGLQEGFRFTVTRLKPGEPELAARHIGEVVVTAVAAQSAVCAVLSKTEDFQVGDVARLSGPDTEKLGRERSSREARKYAQVVGFTEGDPLDQEQRENLTRPRPAEVNRLRGRVSFEFNTLGDRDAGGLRTHQEAVVLRGDMTRIGGSYWNFTGYWRGRLSTRSGGYRPETLTDLLNRTYQAGFYYANPQSKYSAGVGRLLVPWASSLSTIDGGYGARRLGRATTAGVFLGSTPDPTAWNYSPNRQIGGAFVNFELGSFEAVRFSSTAGAALTRMRWKPEREFAFFENTVMYKQSFAVFHNLEADALKPGRLGNTHSGPVVSRSFLTLRAQPNRVVSFDFNHNYFRTIPTFDLTLIGTGLLDKLLFQGVSAGVRVDLPYRVSLYANIGESSRRDDARSSRNQMYSATFGRIGITGLRADVRHSQFQSAFGSGSYQAVSLSRAVGERLRLEAQGGKQAVRSSLTRQSQGYFVNSNLDWLFGAHYILGGGLTVFRGDVQNYDHLFVQFGYRF